MERERAPVAASGALLWLVHALLQENGWVPADATPQLSCGGSSDGQGFAGDVNMLPQVAYRVGLDTPNEEVAVRALCVGDSLFVHFVAAGKSLRLPLKYVAACPLLLPCLYTANVNAWWCPVPTGSAST